MIELIFVIVIIGILAAVAVPRMSATRDDAEISTALASLGTCIKDVGAMATAQAAVDAAEFATISSCATVNTDAVFEAAWDGGTKTLTITNGTSTDSWVGEARTRAAAQGNVKAFVFGGTAID